MTAATELVLEHWVEVCEYHDLLPERGAAALVDGVQVAVFRLANGSLRALDNLDPCSGAYVLSRGIVGTSGTANSVNTVASPMHKQRFDLDTGQCLDDDSISVPTYPVRLVGESVQLDVS
ncbi:nitrite reductase small subunit NirD [Fodinicola feengrottensis]|uniref:Nitrite reductase small subunit NirD n=1 Tax=Fodinicola feengrottensis TaxID=435914 RepID=A0ABP4TSU9_9ACTN|nr:nitrite reductase small subunit NirD [Fodinicola feengrottensis]